MKTVRLDDFEIYALWNCVIDCRSVLDSSDKIDPDKIWRKFAPEEIRDIRETLDKLSKKLVAEFRKGDE